MHDDQDSLEFSQIVWKDDKQPPTNTEAPCRTFSQEEEYDTAWTDGVLVVCTKGKSTMMYPLSDVGWASVEP